MTVALGVWADGHGHSYTATLIADARLWEWIVNRAASRGDKTYTIALGTPALKVVLT